MTLGDLPASDVESRRPGVSGGGSLYETARYIQKQDAERVLLLTGRSSFYNSGADEILSEISTTAEILQWNEFSPNPNLADLVNGLDILHAFNPDLVVAIGGGSVMDMAKLLCAFDGLTSIETIESAIRSSAHRSRRRNLVLAPTTAGSGSEATHFAVIYIGDDKFSVADSSLLPDFVVLDPNLTLSGSPYQKATSGLDALAQAVESLWSVNATHRSIAYATAALKRLKPALVSLTEGSSHSAQSMLEGSYLAGRAIDISKTTGPHAMSYGLTKRYNISHGHAVISTFSAFANAIVSGAFPCQAPLTDMQLKTRLDSIARLIDANGPFDIGNAITNIVDSTGLTLGLRNLGVSFEALASLADGVNIERLSNNPVRLSHHELLDILEQSW